MTNPTSLEAKLLILQQNYARHLKVKAGQFGFAALGYDSMKTYATIQEAIDAEAEEIESKVAIDRGHIKSLEGRIVGKLAHIVILQEKLSP